MPILIFSPVQIIMTHPLLLLICNFKDCSFTFVLSCSSSKKASTIKQPLWGRIEKTNKPELWNRTHRVLIHIFEIGMKTFFLRWEISRSKSQFKKIKNGPILFFWGWRLNFFGFKTFPEMSINFCKSMISW